MYKIRFQLQTRHGEPDVEFGTILLTKEDYAKLPVLSFEAFDHDSIFTPITYFERLRDVGKKFHAIQISNENWHMHNDDLVNDQYYWFLVCLDMTENIWIAFKEWDEARVCDSYDSTVKVSHPAHGEVYRLDVDCEEICKSFYK